MFKLPKTKLEFVKFVATKVATYGTGLVAARVIANNVMPGELNLPKKVAVVIAGAILTGMLQDAVSRKTESLIDSVVEGYVEYMDQHNKKAA